MVRAQYWFVFRAWLLCSRQKIIKMQLFSHHCAGDPSFFFLFVWIKKLSFSEWWNAARKQGRDMQQICLKRLTQLCRHCREELSCRNYFLYQRRCAYKTSVHNKVCPHEQSTILFHYAWENAGPTSRTGCNFRLTSEFKKDISFWAAVVKEEMCLVWMLGWKPSLVSHSNDTLIRL